MYLIIFVSLQNFYLKSIYFISSNISLNTLSQCISLENILYNNFFFISFETLIPAKTLEKSPVQVGTTLTRHFDRYTFYRSIGIGLSTGTVYTACTSNTSAI